MNKQYFRAIAISLLAWGNLCLVEKAQASEFTDQVNLLTIDFNQRLGQGITGLNQNLSEANISLFDTYSLYKNDFPNEFTNTTDACIQGPPLAPSSAPTSICNNPSEYVYFDDVHPTSAAANRIADIANDALDPGVVSALDEVFIFGDSLSDRNNLFTFTGGTFPPTVAPAGPLAGTPLYSPGGFTDDSLWWEHLISDLNLPTPTPYYATLPTTPEGGINFAVAGATTGQDNTGNAMTPPFPIDLPGVEDQIDAFSSFFATDDLEINPNALYIVYAGGNNFLGALNQPDPNNPFGPFTDFTLNPQQPVDDLLASITTLHNLGARNFLVGNLLPLGDTPLASDFEELNNTIPEPNTIIGSLLITGILLPKLKKKK